jgi:hypothetical protein
VTCSEADIHDAATLEGWASLVRGFRLSIKGSKKCGRKIRLLERFLEDGPVVVLLGHARCAVTGRKDERDALPLKFVGDSIGGLTVQIHVEQRDLYGLRSD